MIGVDVADSIARFDASARLMIARGTLVDVVASSDDDSDLPTDTMTLGICDIASSDDDSARSTDAETYGSALSTSIVEESRTVFGVSTFITPNSDSTSMSVARFRVTDSDPTNDERTSMSVASARVTFASAVEVSVSTVRSVLR